MKKHIKAPPFIGKEYETGLLGKRLLILGESHYCKNIDEYHSNITIDIINDLLDPLSLHEEYKNTYIKFSNAIACRKLDKTERGVVWNKVSFYNYVQEPISGPRKSPTRQMFCRSEDAFWEVLELLRPDGVIVWGKRLYNNLPNVGQQLEDLILPDGSGIEVWEYSLIDGKQVRLLPINHPSGGWSTDYWGRGILEFIKTIS